MKIKGAVHYDRTEERNAPRYADEEIKKSEKVCFFHLRLVCRFLFCQNSSGKIHVCENHKNKRLQKCHKR